MPQSISVITPLFNSKRFVRETIQSVIDQTLTEWEMIIVDDCSDDGSYAIAESFADDNERIQLVRLGENSGPATARNRAIEMASGRYLAFLDSDDLWMPDKLERQLKFMQEAGHAFTYTSYEIIDEEGAPAGEKRVPDSVTYKDLLKTCPIGCLTAMYDTRQLGKQFMPKILKRQDYGLWLKLLKQCDRAHGLDEKLASYRVRSNSVSSNKFKAAAYQWKIYRQVEKLSLHRSAWYFTNYAVHGMKNRL